MKRNACFPFFALILTITLRLSAQPFMVLQPHADPETPNVSHRVIWSTEPGIRYALQRSSDLSDPSAWETMDGYPSQAAALAQQEAISSDESDKVFYRVVQLDDRPPKVVNPFPRDGAFGVRRFATLQLQLEDQSGVNPDTIVFSLPPHGAFTLADPELSFDGETLTFWLGGDTALGGYGEVLVASLVATDYSGNTLEHAWAFELEVELEEAENLFVFGSPDAQRAGQRLRGAAATLAARYQTGPVRMGDGAVTWEILSVEPGSILLSYAGDTPPGFQPGQVLANLAPAHVSEIFYRRVTGTETNPDEKTLTLFTEEVGLADVMSGTFSLDGEAVMLEFDENGALVRSFSFDHTFGFPTVGIDLSGEKIFEDDDTTLKFKEAKFLFSPEVSVHLQTTLGHVERFEVEAGGTMDVACVPELVFTGAEFKPEKPKEKELFQHSHWLAAGYVYLEFKTTITLKATASLEVAATFSTGYRQTRELSVLGVYTRAGGFEEPVFKQEVEAETLPLSYRIHGQASASVWIEPRLDIRLYGAAGLYAYLDPKVEIAGEAEMENGELTSASFGITGSIGITSGLSVFGMEDDDLPDFGRFGLLSKTWRVEYPGVPLVVVHDPEDLTVEEGDTIRLNVEVEGGDGNYLFEWYKVNGENSVAIPTSKPYLEISNASQSSAGVYRVRVTSAAEDVDIEVATLAVTPPKPRIFIAPTSHSRATHLEGFGVASVITRNIEANALQVVSETDWIHNVNLATFGLGDQYTLSYQVSGNPGGFRSGEILLTYGDLTLVFTVYQPAAPGSLGISPTSRSHGAAVATGQTIGVTASENVEWAALSTAAWIDIIGGEEGQGDGEITYQVTANEGGPRSGSIVVFGGGLERSVLITQEGKEDEPPTPAGMVRVQGGTLNTSNALNGTVVNTFFIGRHEVTWGEWQAVRAHAAAQGYDIGNVGAGCADDHPVHTVNWYDVLKWCNLKSELEGLTPVYTFNGTTFKETQPAHTAITQNPAASGYRLPLEAEWEFAARGGVKTKGYLYSGSNNANLVAWYRDNSVNSDCVLAEGRGSMSVGLLDANEIEVYDMSGNVYEWCWDAVGMNRIFRGGSWYNNATDFNVASRHSEHPSIRSNIIGLRVARSSGRTTYLIITGSYTWHQAKSDAEARGGHLATITSIEEHNEIVRQIGLSAFNQGFWIGGWQNKANPNFGEPAGGWEWVTGEKFEYTRWLHDQPDNNAFGYGWEQNYLLYNNSEFWDDQGDHIYHMPTIPYLLEVVPH